MSADGEEMVTGTQVSYIGKDCTMIPSFLAKKYGHRAKRLDLSFNLLRTGYREQHRECLQLFALLGTYITLAGSDSF
ncbi:leucine-rich melanocyte differentiation-associated protein-like isoform X4 [Hyla sarda]|uniref:leucine-rich melanocyte differentiation-associated protein-like isoform X4 n=1 Tax=Hyla sarda TaxID=327740 RepID=UPI0024C2FC96|nr:leucine-rich melanocyte differentiation-associated protein-like isoform X4 [Hyla sarda]